jgi:hypothetical protein
MTSTNHPEIDMARLQTDLSREEARRAASPVGWRIRRWTLALAVNGVLFIVAIPLIAGDGVEAFDPDRPRLWFRVGAAVLLAAFSMWNLDRTRRKTPNAADAADIAAANFERQIEKLRGIGWVGRTVRQGAILGLAIGVPIGFLLAAIPLPVIEQAGLWGRIGMAGMFIGATLLWTIPMAFGIRWLSLFSMKKYLVRP